MAFNPFHGFRKHKKVIFAILTIICMFTFVLTGFQGGCDSSMRWGGGYKKGEVVARLYGDKVHQGQIDERAHQRDIANKFISYSLQQGNSETEQEVLKRLQQPPPSQEGNPDQAMVRFRNYITDTYWEVNYFRLGLVRGELQQALYFKMQQDLQNIRKNEPLAQFRYDQAVQRVQQDAVGTLLSRRQQLSTLRKSLASKGREEEVKIVDGLLTRLAFNLWLHTISQERRDRRESFVLGGSTSRQDVLDFMVWLKQADNLGIKLTRDDVRAALATYSPLKPPLTGEKSKDMATISVDGLYSREARIDLNYLYQALTDEFRVVLAQGIILGEEPGLLGFRPSAFRDPLGVTPTQYVTYHNEQLEEARVVLLPVPVDAFTKSPQIKEPTARQIQEEFERYKNQPPRPSSPLPGFKIPQKFQAQWLVDRLFDVRVLRGAAEVLPLAGFLNEVEDGREQAYLDRANRHLISLLAAGNPISLIEAAGHLTTAYDAVLTQGTRRTLDGADSAFALPSLLQADPAPAFHTAMNLRTVIAATLGHASTGNPLASLLGWQGAHTIRGPQYQEELIKQERTKRARIVGGLLGHSVSAPLGSLGGWAWANSQHETFPDNKGNFKIDPPAIDTRVPLQAIRFQVIDQALSELASRLRREDLTEFQKQFKEAKGDRDEALKVINRFKERMHLQHSMGESRFDDTEFTAAKDPGLRPLLRAMGGQFEEDQRMRKRFAEMLSRLPGPYQAPRADDPNTNDLRLENATFVYWLTKNEPARVPSEASEEVRRALIEKEARKIARKRADEIRKQVQDAGGEQKALEVLNGLVKENPGWGHLVHLPKVSRQVEEKRTEPTDPVRYKSYRISDLDIEYPTTNFVDQLLQLKENEAGVLADQPQDIFYVAYVVKRTPAPAPSTILAAWDKVTEDRERPELWRQLSEKQREERRKTIMEELRRQAGKLNARGHFELEPGVKADDTTTTDE